MRSQIKTATLKCNKHIFFRENRFGTTRPIRIRKTGNHGNLRCFGNSRNCLWIGVDLRRVMESATCNQTAGAAKMLYPYENGNRLIDALAIMEKHYALSLGEVVQLRAGQVIHTPGSQSKHVIFPMDAVLAVLADLDNGSIFELGLIGAEGAAGVDIAFGALSLRRIVCQIAGRALRIPTTAFLEAVNNDRCFDMILRATERAHVFYLEQMVVCNATHTVQQRLARWILFVTSRAARELLPITHQAIADSLRVRRAGISDAASNLKMAGAIRYSRGSLRVLDRPLLESYSCTCFRQVTKVFDDALGGWDSESPGAFSLETIADASSG
jgi:CRP-like cAMP-binding protein